MNYNGNLSSNGTTWCNGTTALVTFTATNGMLELDNLTIQTTNQLMLGGALASATTQGNLKIGGMLTINTANNRVYYQAMANPGPSTISGPGTLLFNAATQGFQIDKSSSVAATDPEVTVSATIAGTAGFIKDGGGMLMLSGSNDTSYSGTTTVTRGILRASGGHAISDSSIVSLANSVSAGLEVVDGQEIVGSLAGGGTTAGFVRVLSNGQLNVGTDNTNQTFSGLLMGGTAGATGFVKSGTGNLTLNIAAGGQVNSTTPPTGQLSSYVGNIQITGIGKLLLGSSWALPLSSTVIIDSAATFDVNGAVDHFMGSVSGTGAFTNNVGTAGTAYIGADNANQTFNGKFTGTTLQIVKIGSGTQTFNNTVAASTNTDTANLYLHNGTLALAGSGTLDPINFGNIYVRGTSTLLIDNTAASANRITDGRNIIMGGGTVWFKPNQLSTDTTETVNTLNWEHGGGTIILEASAGGKSVLNVTTLLNYGSGDWWHPILLEGTGLGTAAPGAGVTNLMATANANLWSGFRPEIVGVTNTTGDMSGVSYVTYDATKGFRLMTNADLPAVTATTNTSNAGRLASVLTLTNFGQTIVGGLKMEPGASIAMSSLSMPEFRLNGNSILVQPNNGSPAVISGGWIGVQYGQPLYIHGYGDLTINSRVAVNATTGLGYGMGIIKTGGGTLTLGLQQGYTSSTAVYGGTLKMGGGDFTIPMPVNSAGVGVQNLHVGITGTLDLNGTTELGKLYAVNVANYSDLQGGTITNSSGSTATIVSINDSEQTFQGTIKEESGAGAVSLVKNHANILNVTGVNTYHGTTTVTGGSLRLIAHGTLNNTSLVNVNYGTLELNNQGLGSVNDRVNPAATVVMRGGSISLLGGAAQKSTQTFVTIDLAQGLNTFTANPGAVGVADITINNLTRSGQYATLQFTETTANTFGIMPTDPSGYGQNTLVSHVFVNNINGAPVTLTNGIIGGWAFRSDYFATYDPIQGIGYMGQGGGFLGFSNVQLNLAGPNDVIQQGDTAGVTTRTIYALRVNNGRIELASPTDTLTIASGGICASANATWIQNGKITSGLATGELYLMNTGNTFQINSQIVDNGSTPVTVVKSGTGTLSLTGLAGSNTYTGGTVVNGGTLNLDGVAGVYTLGGASLAAQSKTTSLVLNGATVNENLCANQIPANTVVTMNGNSRLNLLGDNTLAGLNFTNEGLGGSTAINAVQIPSSGKLTLTGNISVQADNYAQAAMITTRDYAAGLGQNSNVLGPNSYLDLNNQTRTITVNGVAPVGLAISSVIQNGAIVKEGTGALSLLSPANTFSDGVTLNAGNLLLGRGGAGTGIITVNGGSITGVYSSGQTPTIGNTIVVNSSFAIGGTQAGSATAYGNDITLAGPITLANTGTSTVTVTSPYVTATISGVISGTGTSGFGKSGPGFMVLAAPTYTDATNSWTGPTAVNGGFLKLGYQGALPATSGQLQIGGGGVLDLNGFSATVASLADGLAGGGGVVNNNGTANQVALLTAGSDNLSTTFSGALFANTAANLAFTKTGSGTLTLTGDNSYAGLTRVQGGVLDVTLTATLPHLPSLPTNSGLVISNGAVVQSSGTLTRNVVISPSTGTVTWQEGGGGFAARGADLTVNLGGSAGMMTWDSAGFVNDEDPLVLGSSTADHTVIWQNPIRLNASGAVTREIRVNAGTGAAPEAILQGIISEGTAPAGLSKTGSGTLKLTAANTYTGNTNIMAGKLVVNGSILSNATTPTVSMTTVYGGATLAGAGTITGPVAVNSLGHVAPGDGTVATLSTGSFTISSGGILDYSFGAAGTPYGSSSMIAVNGLLTLPTGPGSITLNLANLSESESTYKLFTYGSISTTASDLTSLFTFGSTAPTNMEYHVVNVAGTKEVDLQLMLIPSRVDGIWAQAAGATNTWATQSNWLDSKKPGANLGDTAVFGDVIGNDMVVTMDANRQLAALTINSASHSYTIAQGSTGGGVLSLVTTGTTATVTVQGGRQQTISAPIALGSNVLFTVDPSTSLAVSGEITESTTGKSVTKAGSGTLSLINGSNSYTGITDIEGGTLEATTLADGGVTSSIGKSAKDAANLVLNNGTLEYTGGGTSTDRLFTLGALGGVLNASGAGAVNFTNTDPMGLASGGNRTLSLTGTNAGDNKLAASIGDASGATTAVAKSGTGTWVLSGSNSYTGGTTVSAGTLKVGSATALGGVNNGGLSMSGSGKVDMNGRSIEYGNALTSLSGGTDNIITNSSTGTVTMAVKNTATSTYGGTIRKGGSTADIAVEKYGSGTLVLSGDNGVGNNGFGGGVTVGDGTVQLGNDNALGTGGLTMGNSHTTGTPTVDMHGQGPTVTSLNGLTGTITNSVAGSQSTLTVKNAGTSTYNGTITGNSALVKDGAGELALGGVNTYSGDTTVKDGLLTINNADALPSTTVLKINGGTNATVVLASDLPSAIELSGLEFGSLVAASSSYGSSSSSYASSSSSYGSSSSAAVNGSSSPVQQMAASTTPTAASSLNTGLSPAAEVASRVSTGGTAAVPEPGTIALLLAGAAMGLVALLRRRNRKS